MRRERMGDEIGGESGGGRYEMGGTGLIRE